MKKSLILAFALAASVLAFVSCNKDDKNDPETTTTSIKGVKFYCDYERGGYVREYIYFGLQDNIDWGWEMYEDDARTKLTSNTGDYGTYVLNEEQKYIDMTFKGSFEEDAEGKRTTHEGRQAHRDGRQTYELNGDTISLTAESGYTMKYWKKK